MWMPPYLLLLIKYSRAFPYYWGRTYLFFTGCAIVPRTLNANTWNVPWNASFHSIHQNITYKQLHVCSRCTTAVSRTCSVCQKQLKAMRTNVRKYVWHKEQCQRLETLTDLPLFIKVIIEHFALFYKFVQVSEMFFLSRNNSVVHIADEYVFAFSLVSENYCSKYVG